MVATVLSDFSRGLRDEPLYYIYKHKIFIAVDGIDAKEVHDHFKKRYVETKKGNRYRIGLYTDKNGVKFVDHVLLETLSEDDLVFLKLRWPFSRNPITRLNRRKRIKLTSEQVQRRKLVLEAFYASL